MMTPFLFILTEYISASTLLVVLLSIFSLTIYLVVKFQLVSSRSLILIFVSILIIFIHSNQFNAIIPPVFNGSMEADFLCVVPNCIIGTFIVLCNFILVMLFKSSRTGASLQKKLMSCLKLGKSVYLILQYYYVKNFILGGLSHLRQVRLIIFFILLAYCLVTGPTLEVTELQPYGASGNPDDFVREFKDIKIISPSGDNYSKSLEDILKDIKTPPGGNYPQEVLDIASDLKQGRKHWSDLNNDQREKVSAYILDNYWALLIGVRAKCVEIDSLTWETKNMLLAAEPAEREHMDRLDAAEEKAFGDCARWCLEAKEKESMYKEIGRCLKYYNNNRSRQVKLSRLYLASLRKPPF